MDQFDLEDDHVTILKPIRMSQEWATVLGVTEVKVFESLVRERITVSLLCGMEEQAVYPAQSSSWPTFKGQRAVSQKIKHRIAV